MICYNTHAVRLNKWFGILLLVVCLTGCWENKVTIQLNPDGSGRFKVDGATKMVALITGIARSKMKDARDISDAELLAGMKKLAPGGMWQGVSAWEEFSAHTDPETGITRIRVSLLFDDIRKLRLPTNSSFLSAVSAGKFENPPPLPFKFQQAGGELWTLTFQDQAPAVPSKKPEELNQNRFKSGPVEKAMADMITLKLRAFWRDFSPLATQLVEQMPYKSVVRFELGGRIVSPTDRAWIVSPSIFEIERRFGPKEALKILDEAINDDLVMEELTYGKTSEIELLTKPMTPGLKSYFATRYEELSGPSPPEQISFIPQQVFDFESAFKAAKGNPSPFTRSATGNPQNGLIDKFLKGLPQ